MRNMIWKAQRSLYRNGTDLALFSEEGGKVYAGQPINIEIKEAPGRYIGRPTLELPDQNAQSLMDALYDAGFRPTNAKPQDETIKSITYHLEDMRRLVFHRTKVR